MKPYCLNVRIALVLVFIGSFLQAKIISPNEYPFPIPSSELATIASAIPYKGKYAHSRVALELFPERSKVYLMEERHRLNLLMLKQNHQAPLVFVIPGVGGSGGGPVVESLMEQLYELGYHVVALPNPLSWVFTLGVSQKGVPGYIAWDVKDLYNLMEKTAENLQAQKVEIQGYRILGFSLGAGLLPELVKLDDSQKKFQFEKVIMMNPPVNFNHGVTTLDNYYQVGSRWANSYKESLKGYLYTFAEKIINNKDKPLPELLGRFSLGKEEQQYIIGSNYRESLGDIIYVMELLLNQKVLTTEISWGQRTFRLEESRSFSFKQYLEKILLTRINVAERKSLTLKQVIESYNLKNYQQQFVSDKRFYIFHNQDDFLLETGDVDFFETSFPSRAFVFPLGGHCGNFSFPVNKMYLKLVMNGGF